MVRSGEERGGMSIKGPALAVRRHSGCLLVGGSSFWAMADLEATRRRSAVKVDISLQRG
jgi:hypothetical protein